MQGLRKGLICCFDTEFISAPGLFDYIEMEEEEIDEILASYFITYKNLNASEAAKYLAAGLYIKYLLKVYKNVKEYYFKNNRETLFLELEALEKEKNALKQKTAELQQVIAEQEKLIGELRQKLNVEYARAMGTVELIVFNTAFLNHGMYYKVINFARKNKIRVCYAGNQNVEITIEQIWKNLMK